MYRDSATLLDEHDRAVGAILIGEALAAGCDRAASRASADDTPRAERWRAVADANDAYPEIWRHLDRARRVLAARGANTAKFDELRPCAPRSVTSSDGAGEPAIDPAALDEARRAIAELKLALPGAEWDAIEKRTDGLVRVPLSRHRRNRISLLVVLTVFGFALATWIVAIMPHSKVSHDEERRRELQGIATQRTLRIGELLVLDPAARCDTPRAQELARLLAQDGQGESARAFGRDFGARCGADPIVARWANAPLQRRR